MFNLSGCYVEYPENDGVGTWYYTITFDGNGNTGGSVPASMQVAEGSVITLPGQGSMLKNTYSFYGWRTKIEYMREVDIYDIGVSYTVRHSNTLYARWLPIIGQIESFTDVRDNQAYKTVKIWNQKWMAENLNYQTDSSWCYGDADSNCVKYGRLYTWNAAKIACPSGWHLPTSEEWRVLTVAAGWYGYSIYGASDTTRMQWKVLRSTSGWSINDNGTDDIGFSALPGGVRRSDAFYHAGIYSYWWTAMEDRSNANAYYLYMGFINENVTGNTNSKSTGCSVRCVQD